MGLILTKINIGKDAMNKPSLAAHIAFVTCGAVALSISAYATTPNYVTDVRFAHDNYLDVQVSLTIPAHVLENDTITLMLSGVFEVESVQGDTLGGYASQPSPQIPPWNEHILEFEPGYDTHRVQLNYSGTLNPQHGHGNEATESLIHLSIDSAWHPFFMGFATMMRGEVNLQLDESWKVYSPGSQARDADSVTLSMTSPQIDVALFATQSDSVLEEQGFSVVYDEPNNALATETLAAGSACLISLNSKFGADTPLDSATLILLDREGPSFARGNYISVNSNNVESAIAGHQLACHEIAHNWTAFGDAMSHDYWMPESFAELVAAREIKAQFGDEAYQNIKAVWRELAEGTKFVWREDVPERASHRVNYGLGPLKLLQLEERVGEDTFNQFVKRYMESDIAQTTALLDMLAALTDLETSEWFHSQLVTGLTYEPAP